jgi:hypothetical protein
MATSLSTLPHMAVVSPDTSYQGAPRPRMGISSATGYTTKALSPEHQRVRQGINSSSRLALWEKTENTRLPGHQHQVRAAARSRSSTGAKPAPRAQFNTPWVIVPTG